MGSVQPLDIADRPPLPTASFVLLFSSSGSVLPAWPLLTIPGHTVSRTVKHPLDCLAAMIRTTGEI